MSEQGWHECLDAGGVDDRVVLHGGATAAFRVRSRGDAARVAEAVAKAPETAGGRIVDDAHAPSHWTLSDEAGRGVCICAWPDGSTLVSLSQHCTLARFRPSRA